MHGWICGEKGGWAKLYLNMFVRAAEGVWDDGLDKDNHTKGVVVVGSDSVVQAQVGST